MATIFDRINNELESFGRRASAAFDEARFQVELIRLRRQRDDTARELGKLVYKRERGKDVDQLRIDAQLLRLDDIEASIEKVEKQMGSINAEAVETQPAGTASENEPATSGATAATGVEEGSPS